MTGRRVAIVGAGIVGCLIARELAAADSDAEIEVLDRDLIGSGVTRRSAGLSLARGATPVTRQMSAFSHRYYADLKASHPHLPIYPLGARLIMEGADDPIEAGYLPDLASPAEVSPESGLRQDALAREITWPEQARAWRLAGCHYADVYAVAQALAALARPRVRFREGVEVTGLTAGDSWVTLHCGSGEHLTADQVVLAPGPWLAAPAWRELVEPLGLRVKKIVAMHIEQAPAAGDELIIFESEDAFLLPLAHRGHWLFSYTAAQWDVDPDKLAAGPGLSAGDVEAARSCLRRYSPALAEACGSGRVCCDAYSPSREPVVCALDQAGRIAFAGAANGSGYRLGPAIAAQAVELLTRNESRSQGASGDHLRV
jgi:D-arginine dehydrogenase